MKLITTPEALLIEICELINADIKSIKSECRKDELVIIRSYISYIGNIYYKFSAASLGKSMGGRDHSTVFNHIKNVKKYLDRQDVKTVNDLTYLFNSLELNESPDNLMEQMGKMYDTAIEEIKVLRLKVKSQEFEIAAMKKKIELLSPKNIFGEPIY